MSSDRKSGYFRPELEKMTGEQRNAYQALRLREVLGHAWENAPAIRKRLEGAGIRLDDIGGVDDLEKLPVLKKTELIEEQRSNLPFGGFCALHRAELRRIYVSPGPIYEPGEREYEDYRWAQALYAGGFRSGDIAQITFNFNMVPVGFWLDEALQQLGCISVPAGVGNTELQIQIMKELGVAAYLGTPSFLATIAERAEKTGTGSAPRPAGSKWVLSRPNRFPKRFAPIWKTASTCSFGKATAQPMWAAWAMSASRKTACMCRRNASSR